MKLFTNQKYVNQCSNMCRNLFVIKEEQTIFIEDLGKTQYMPAFSC
jgi:hypothetical protein